MTISSRSAASEENDRSPSQFILAELNVIKQLIKENNFNDVSTRFSSLEAYAKAQSSSYDIGLVLHSRGNSLYKHKQYEEAIPEYLAAAGYLTEAQDETRKLLLLANCYHQIGQSYKHLKNVNKSVEYYQLAVDIHTLIGDQVSIGRALKNLAMSENKQGDYLKALDHALQSIEIQKRYSSPSQYAQILLHTGIIYRNIGNYEKSLVYIKQAEALYREEGDIPHLAEVENQTGLIYSQLNQYDNARSFYNETIELPKDKVKAETRAAAFRELARIELETGNLVRAGTFMDNAISIYRAMDSVEKLALSYLIKGKVEVARGYKDLGIQSFQQSFKLAVQVGSLPLQTQSLTQLASLSLPGDPKQSETLFTEALTLSKQYSSNTEQLAIYKGLKTAAKITNNLQDAFEYSEEVNRISEAIYAEHEAKKLAKEKAILESYKLEQELTDLQEKVKLEQLKVIQKNSEIKIIKQAHRISDLELSKKQTLNIFLSVFLCVMVLLAFLFYRSVVVLRKKNYELDYLAMHDSLTGCYNRRAFFSYLQKQFEAGQLGQPCTIILADLDSFKKVNDQFGHGVGDAVLCGVADILERNFTEQDCIARIGGEEFCIILPNTNATLAMSMAEGIRKQIAAKTISNVSVTCSLGIASLNASVETPDELLECADKALYQSKNDGRNRVTLWT
ncbi:tetratricopeptide repeat-containing diguanylate cyclase [Vibrio algarum]|uniref:diguanylate cyclase n=1 Tax=Vibrio algarum TaxID=3020714 RepID=A0ABT4YUQ0_9VIBR|nr:diguanylate cyclase [Vibrio sp. KJ40-1]MDB1125085.1 diguanylate cyclase [Vibrio sp. KJ40-1]